MPTLLERVVPVGAVGVEHAFDDPTVLPSLFPDEESLVADAAPRRRHDVMAGRWCARDALALIGISPIAIPSDPHGVPSWPPGVVGSITHTRVYAAAIVGWRRDWRALGLDAEDITRVHAGLEPLIATPAELRWLTTLSNDHRARARTLLFSAKEAVYKCQFPITNETLEFEDVDLQLSDPEHVAESGRFVARFRSGVRAHGLPMLEGRYAFGADHLVTVAALADS